MNDVIWKYDVPVAPTFDLELRLGAKPLCVQMQDGKPRLWVLLSEHYRVHTYKFFIVPTGKKFDATSMNYIGTFQPETGLVFHLFWAML